MNESQRLADQLTRALNGNAWHGPSWKETLEGVTREAALQRPIPEGHSIAEIVLHATTWNDVVRRRLEGETPEVTDAQDWPTATFADEGAWTAVVARLFEAGNALAATIARFPAEKLHEKRPGVDGAWYELVIGQLQHTLYHAGQAGILKKAHARVTA
jgi:L-ascorbate metabolism protein UlaG (beta-lactamase superfamily)